MSALVMLMFIASIGLAAPAQAAGNTNPINWKIFKTRDGRPVGVITFYYFCNTCFR
jgi:hypothetical protein